MEGQESKGQIDKNPLNTRASAGNMADALFNVLEFAAVLL